MQGQDLDTQEKLVDEANLINLFSPDLLNRLTAFCLQQAVTPSAQINDRIVSMLLEWCDKDRKRQSDILRLLIWLSFILALCTLSTLVVIAVFMEDIELGKLLYLVSLISSIGGFGIFAVRKFVKKRKEHDK